MRRWTTHPLLAVICLTCLATKKMHAQGKELEKTYALVVGISQYQNATIPRLQYADKDATLFAEWLQSKAGGSIPSYQVKLLTNENASLANVYNGFDWLKTVTAAEDKVFIYFSGHGDIETADTNSQGYLLAWNSPSTNYRNNAVSVSDLNEMANILTTQNHAKVIIITDACHSGKMAGDFYKGRQLTATNLRLVLNNQVRLASCEAGEEAAEGPAWGGGRGVFSYHLLRGLQGLAPADTNGVVRLSSLQQFLQTAFKTDATLAIEKHKQNPVVDGSPLFAIVAASTEHRLLQTEKLVALQSTNRAGLQSLKSIGRQPMDCFFSIFNTAELDTLLPFSSYAHLPIHDVPLMMVTDYIKAIKQPGLQRSGLLDTLAMLHAQLERNKFLVARFNEKLVEITHEKMQEMINAYLTGDLAELEKRQYYYMRKRQYRSFLPVIELAIHVCPGVSYLARILRTNLAYVAGLIDRLEMTSNSQTDSLLKSAFTHQGKALQLDPYAAYIHNEAGNLYLQRNDYDSADYHFGYALLLSPTWAVPWSNKIRLNLARRQLSSAKEAIRTADSLQPNLAFVNVNAGLVMEKDSNWLAAESFYLRAIAQNNVHYLPYQRLGMVYIQMGNYAMADSFLLEAKTRKESFNLNEEPFRHGIMMVPRISAPGPPRAKVECDVKTSMNANPEMPIYQLTRGLISHSDSGAKEIIQAIALSPSLPLAHHYLGARYFADQDFQLAERYLTEAKRRYLPPEKLRTLLDSLVRLSRQPGSASTEKLDMNGLDENIERTHTAHLTATDSCLLHFLLSRNYDELEDHYMLATIFEKQGRVAQALGEYEILCAKENQRLMAQANFATAADPLSDSMIDEQAFRKRYDTAVKMGAVIKAARLLEQLGRYDEAERLLLLQVDRNRKAGDARQSALHKPGSPAAGLLVINNFWLNANHDLEAETYNFYDRVLGLHPRDARWHEAAGMFLYTRLSLTYKQIALAEQKLFYNFSEKQAYPYKGKFDDYPWLKAVTFNLPGTGKELSIPLKKYDPLITAKYHLQQAEKFSGDEVARPVLLSAITELDQWMGNTDAARSGYSALLKLQPDNVIARNALIEILEYTNRFPAAAMELDSLSAKTSLTPRQKVKQLYYKIFSKQGREGESLLRSQVPTDAAVKRLKMAMYAHHCLLGGRLKEAMRYLDSANKIIGSPNKYVTQRWIAIAGSHNLKYAKARIYALSQQSRKAFFWLEQLRRSGFVYRNVLDNDPALLPLKSSRRWRKLVADTTPATNANQIGKVLESEWDEENLTPGSNRYKLRLYRIPGSINPL